MASFCAGTVPGSWIQIISSASLTVRRLARALPLWCGFWKRVQRQESFSALVFEALVRA
jgi:hypothetical protein